MVSNISVTISGTQIILSFGLFSQYNEKHDFGGHIFVISQALGVVGISGRSHTNDLSRGITVQGRVSL